MLEALGAALPGRRLAVSELGYGAEDLDDGPWWFGSAQDVAAARTAVAEHVTAAALGREGNVIGYVGSSDNITAAAHCATRLRLVLADLDKVDQKALDYSDRKSVV